MALSNFSWPETIQPESCRFVRVWPDKIIESPVTRTHQTIRRGRPMWQAELNWKLRPYNVAQWRYVIDGLEGQAGDILIRDFGSQDAVTKGTPLVSGGAAKGAVSFAARLWTPSVLVLSAGQLISIGARLYCVAANVTADGSGNATVTIDQGLIQDTPADAAITVTRPACRMRLASAEWSGSRSAQDGLWTCSARFEEDVAP